LEWPQSVIVLLKYWRAPAGPTMLLCWPRLQTLSTFAICLKPLEALLRDRQILLI